jgi:hypothetical protein
MNKRYRYRQQVVDFFLATLLWSFAIASAEDRADVSLRFTGPREAIPLRSAPVALLALTNQGGQMLHTDLGFDHIGAVTLVITGPDGKQRVENKEPTQGLHEPGDIELTPGASYTIRLVLSEWQQFSKVGHYSFVARVDTGNGGVGASRVTLSSAPIMVTVSGSDPKTLEDQCRNLLNAIASDSSYAEVSEAMRRLLTVNEPIAIPYLTAAAQYRPVFARPVTNTVSLFESKEAVKSLEQLAHSSNVETRQFAVNGLEAMQQKTSDDSLRGFIKAALENTRQVQRQN